MLRYPAVRSFFSQLRSFQIGSEAHQGFHLMGFGPSFIGGKETYVVKLSPHFSAMLALRWVALYHHAPHTTFACTFITFVYTSWKWVVLWKLQYLCGLCCCLLAHTFTDMSRRGFKCYVFKQERSDGLKFNYVLYGSNYVQTTNQQTNHAAFSYKCGGCGKQQVAGICSPPVLPAVSVLILYVAGGSHPASCR